MRVSFLSLRVLMVGGSFFSFIPFPAGLEKQKQYLSSVVAKQLEIESTPH
jgi:hypothetical protein